MLQNYSNKIKSTILKAHKLKNRKALVGILVIAGLFAALYASELILLAILFVANKLGFSLEAYNQNITSGILAFIIYLITTLLFGYFINKYVFKISRTEIGLTGLPTWKDIGLSVLGLIIYMIISAGLIALAVTVIPGFDVNESQDIGFANLNYSFEFIIAFITLIVIAPIAEEILFRGYLLGSLLKSFKPWISVVAVSVIFGFVHGSWNVGIDTFALSLVVSIIRINTGTLWSGILVHMVKNSIAFYLLFINPTLLTTLGG